MYMNRFRQFLGRIFGGGESSASRSGRGNFFTRLFNRKERKREQEEYEQRERERRAMQKRLEDAAREAREREEASRAVREAAEVSLKDADRLKLEEERQKAYDTFKERYDWDINRKDWDKMWDVWGGISQEIKDAYGGSDPRKPGGSNLVYMYKELKNEEDRQRFPQILNEVYESAPEGANQEQLVDLVYAKIEALNEGKVTND